MQVSVAPTNTLYLDEYYNGLEGIKKRKYSYTEKPKSFGQSLKDLFFPNVRNPNRKIVKVKKPHLSFVPSPLSGPGPEVRQESGRLVVALWNTASRNRSSGLVNMAGSSYLMVAVM